LSAIGGAALLASSAFAADVAAVAPPPAWGFYFGGGVCYDWADFDFSSQTYVLGHEFGGPKIFNIGAEAPCGTATIGYDYQIDQLFLVGFFASYDWQDKNSEESLSIKLLKKDLTVAQVSVGNIATVGGRAGILVTPEVLVYALVGWSWSDAGFALLPPIGPAASGNVNGPTIGAGIEALFHKNWSGRLEYRLTDFGSLTGTACLISCGLLGELSTARLTDQSVRFVLTYRP
jgi:outer membrane immunogenic protein